MLIKKPRQNGRYDAFDLEVTDANGNIFIMTFGGNGDLYWVPKQYGSTQFIINSDDEILYSAFEWLFEQIKENDNPQNPSLVDNTFTFISEEWEEEASNRLKIKKDENEFVLDFIKNENKPKHFFSGRRSTICFCNSGSRVPRIEQQFSIMFNELAYYNQDVPVIIEDDTNEQ